MIDFLNTLFPNNFIDKLYVFLRPDDSISFIFHGINLEYIYIVTLCIFTLSFAFEMIEIFISHWRRKK